MKKLFPKEKIITTKYFEVHQDWEVPIPGFFVIASKKKTKSIEDFSDEEVHELIMLVKKLRQGMKKILKIKKVFLFQNECSRFTFHMWIFPMYKWMDKLGNRKFDGTIGLVLDYAKKNMNDTKTKNKVKKYVKKMKEYMK